MLVFPEESDNPSLYDFCRGFGLDFEMWDKSILHWSICVARCFLHLIFNAGSEYADRTSQVNVLNCCEPLKLGSQYSWVQSSTKTKLFILQNKTYLRYHQFFFGRMLFTCFIRFFLLVEISMFLPSWWAIQFGRCLFATWGTDYWFLGGDSELWEGWLVWCVFVDGFLKRIYTYLFIRIYIYVICWVPLDM